MTRARDNANLGVQAGSGLDASDITTGVLPVGVTGGSGLNALSTTKSDVGLSNVDNDSTATIRSGTTKSDVGLGSVDNDSTATIRSLLTGSISGRSQSQNASLNVINSYHRRISTSTYTGASSGTFTFMMYGRHWWGTGSFHIHIHETWYGPNASYGHFLIHGHTRSGNPSIGTIYNTGIGTPFPTNYDGSNERCQIAFSHSSYRRFHIIVESYESAYMTSDSNVGHGNSGGGNRGISIVQRR
jgi:hypothetical protein